MKKLYSLIVAICLFFASYAYGQIKPDTNNILYINTNVSGGNGSGDSWTNAIKELADALKWAGQNRNNNLWSSTNPLQLWIADGIYKPKYSPIDGDDFKDNPSDPRVKSFLVVNNIKLYGGFLGYESNIVQRDFTTGNKTILSGDFNGDDLISGNGKTLSITNNKENAYYTLIGTCTNVDGFLITGANKSDLDFNNPINGSSYYHVLNQFTSKTLGAGISGYIQNLGNLTMIGNYTGAMLRSTEISNLINLKVSRNSNVGLSLNYATTIKNSIISDNFSKGISASNPTGMTINLINTVVSGNNSLEGGAGVDSYGHYGNAVRLINCTVVGNTGPYSVRSASARGSDILSYNSIIYGNEGGITISSASIPGNVYKDFSGSLIQGESSTANNNLNGNLSYPNLFTDYSNKNYTLASNSPAVDKGDNALYTTLAWTNNQTSDKDLLGNPRIYNYANGGIIDLGAYESSYTNMGVIDSEKNRIKLYPNSTTGIFYIEAQSAGKSELYNFNGQLVKTVDLKAGKNEIDITTLSNGIYILKLDSRSLKVFKK